MSDHIKKTVEEAMQQVVALETQLNEKKKGVNAICIMFNLPPPYEDCEIVSATNKTQPLIERDDEFYNMPFAKAVRIILDRRNTLHLGSAEPDEIYDTLVAGSFKFSGSNIDSNKAALRISLAKNSSAFVKLPNGKFGLHSWYGSSGKATKKAAPNAINEDDFGLNREDVDSVADEPDLTLEGVKDEGL